MPPFSRPGGVRYRAEQSGAVQTAAPFSTMSIAKIARDCKYCPICKRLLTSFRTLCYDIKELGIGCLFIRPIIQNENFPAILLRNNLLFCTPVVGLVIGKRSRKHPRAE